MSGFNLIQQTFTGGLFSFKASARSQQVKKEKDQENEQALKDQRSQWEQRVKKPYSRWKSGKLTELKTVSYRKIPQVLSVTEMGIWQMATL